MWTIIERYIGITRNRNSGGGGEIKYRRPDAIASRIYFI